MIGHMHVQLDGKWWNIWQPDKGKRICGVHYSKMADLDWPANVDDFRPLVTSRQFWRRGIQALLAHRQKLRDEMWSRVPEIHPANIPEYQRHVWEWTKPRKIEAIGYLDGGVYVYRGFDGAIPWSSRDAWSFTVTKPYRVASSSPPPSPPAPDAAASEPWYILPFRYREAS